MSKVCPNGRLLKLRHKCDHNHIEYRVIPCNNWRKCEVCRERRERVIRWKFWRITEALKYVDHSRYYPVLITLTINPHRYKPYGLYARGLMQVQLNKLMAHLRYVLKYQPLLVVRTYEFHRTGNLHCHLLLALNKSDRLCHARIRKAWGIGFVDFHYGYQDGVRQSQRHNGEVSLVHGINYLLGYALEAEKSTRTAQFHIKGTRYYSISLGRRLQAAAERIHPVRARRTPIRECISIGKLQRRRIIWCSLLTSLSLPRHMLSLLPSDVLSPCLHIRLGNAVTVSLS